MEISGIVYGIIGIVVAVIVIASVLIPTIEGLNLNNSTYTTLLGVVGTLAIIVPIMLAVRMIGGKS
jgi:hypothetical protein